MSAIFRTVWTVHTVQTLRTLEIRVLLLAVVAVTLQGTIRWCAGANWSGRLDAHLHANVRGDVPYAGLSQPWMHDNLQHLAWAKQTREGQWRYDNPFTLEPNAALLINPLLSLMGAVSAWLQVDPIVVLIWSGAAATFISPFLVFSIARRCGLSFAAAFSATLFATFASGLTGVFHHLQLLARTGVDLDFPDVHGFSAQLAFPFIAVAQGIGLFLIHLMLDAETWPGAVGVGRSLLLFSTTLILALSHPYEHIIISSSYLGWCILGSVGRLGARRWAVLWPVAFASLTVLGYHLWLKQQLVWRDVMAASLELPRERLDWLFGYGALTLLAAVGVFRGWRPPTPSLWFAGWYFGLLILLLGFNVSQSKICSLGHLPLAILAGAGVVHLWKFLYSRWAKTIFLIVLAPLLFSSSVLFAVRYVARPAVIEGDRWRILIELANDPNFTRPRVLADTQTARLAVAEANARVYAANFYNTPNFQQKAFELRTLGIEPQDTDAPGIGSIPVRSDAAIEGELLSFLNRHDFDAIILRVDQPAARILSQKYKPMKIRQHGRWILILLR